MRTSHRTSLAAIVLATLALFAGCSAPEEPGPSTSERRATDAEPLSKVTFDASAITTAPAAELPSSPFPASSFSLAMLQKTILRQNDDFTTVEEVGERTVYEGAHWHAEIDPLNGRLLATLNDADGPTSPQDEAMLLADARNRLASFGVPESEIAGVTQHRSMISDDETPDAAPQVDGYKVFFYRGLHGVRIGAGRSVLTYGPDGRFRRALLHWPALAPRGHKMHTKLTTAQIVARATQAVQSEGLKSGKVKLVWRYEPTLANGRVTLTLVVFALVPMSAELGEPRQLQIDVDAG